MVKLWSEEKTSTHASQNISDLISTFPRTLLTCEALQNNFPENSCDNAIWLRSLNCILHLLWIPSKPEPDVHTLSSFRPVLTSPPPLNRPAAVNEKWGESSFSSHSCSLPSSLRGLWGFQELLPLFLCLEILRTDPRFSVREESLCYSVLEVVCFICFIGVSTVCCLFQDATVILE